MRDLKWSSFEMSRNHRVSRAMQVNLQFSSFENAVSVFFFALAFTSARCEKETVDLIRIFFLSSYFRFSNANYITNRLYVWWVLMVLCDCPGSSECVCTVQCIATPRFVIMEASKLITNIRNRQHLKRLCDTVISCKHFYFQYSFWILFFFLSFLLLSLALSKWLIKWQAYVSLMCTIGHVQHHSLRGQLTQGFFFVTPSIVIILQFISRTRNRKTKKKNSCNTETNNRMQIYSQCGDRLYLLYRKEEKKS